MKINKVKYTFRQQQKEHYGEKFVQELKNSMGWVYKTQTHYSVSFDCLGIDDKYLILLACRLFHSVPEAIKRNVGSIQMAPEPQVYWRTPANSSAKLLINLGWERLCAEIKREEQNTEKPHELTLQSSLVDEAVVHLDMESFVEPKAGLDEAEGEDDTIMLPQQTVGAFASTLKRAIAREKRRKARKMQSVKLD